MTNQTHTLRSAAVIVSALALTSLAHAGPVVVLDTGRDAGSDGIDDFWMVTPPSASGSSPATIVTSPNSAWASAASVGDGTADWISTVSSGTTGVPGGIYHYDLALSLTPDGIWQFEGAYTSDNEVESLILWDATFNTQILDLTDAAGGNNATGQFRTVFDFNDITGVISGDFVLRATVDNFTSSPNPSGFILDGTASFIPMPHPAALAAMPLVGLAGLRRRRTI